MASGSTELSEVLSEELQLSKSNIEQMNKTFFIIPRYTFRYKIK